MVEYQKIFREKFERNVYVFNRELINVLKSNLEGYHFLPQELSLSSSKLELSHLLLLKEGAAEQPSFAWSCLEIS